MRRRRVVAMTGTAVSLALAGCSSSPGDSATGDSDATSDSTAGTSEPSVDVDFRVTLGGLTASNIDRPDDEGIAGRIATDLGIAPDDVQVRTTPDTVEVFAGDISADEFTDALSAAGVSNSQTEIRSGVTAATRQRTADILEQRLDREGIDGSVTVENGSDAAVLIDVPGGRTERARELIENPGNVQVVAGYPDPDSEDEPVMDEVLTADDFATIRGATQTVRGGSVGVTLTAASAEQFAQTMIDAGFTREGRGNCDFDPETDDPDPDDHCLYTVVNGEIVTGVGMGDLAEVIDPEQSGDYSGFVADPSFQITTADFETARRLSLLLQSGSLPTEIRVEAVTT